LRILKYEAILLKKDDLTLTSDHCLTPAELLVGGQSSSPVEHCSLDLIEYQTKVRPHLLETPFETGDKFIVDSSSWVTEGKRHNEYSVIDGTHLTVINQA
jgi:hypothetical protein